MVSIEPRKSQVYWPVDYVPYYPGTSLLFPDRDFDSEVCWFHKPIIYSIPLSLRMLQLKVEFPYNKWYQLGHLQKGDVAADARS